MSVGLYSGVSGLALGTGLYKNVSGLWGGASGLIDGFAGTSPFSGASLYLNFLAGAPLDSRVTFTRGSNATLVDSTGKITYAPANLLLQSQTFDNAAWVKSGLNTTGTPAYIDVAVSPDGTQNADFMIEDTANSQHTTRVSASLSATTTHTYSFFAKAAGRTNVSVNRFNSGVVPSFDHTFTLTGSGASSGGTVTALSNGWYRCSGSFTTTGAGVGGFIILLSDGTGTTYTGDGTSGIFIWGAQLEPVTYQTTPSTYVATTSAAYYGPRFDYDPVTLAAKGLLIEEQRTNLALYSEQFDNAAWTKTAATVTANATASPDGTSNADKLVEDTSTSQHRTDQTPTSLAGAQTFSVFAKAAERAFMGLRIGSIGCGFNLSNGTTYAISAGVTATIVSAGDGWYRCSISVSSASANDTCRIGLAQTAGTLSPSYTGDGTSGIFVYGAQLEAGAFATSYIPTVASQVTRSADVATMTGTNFSSWYNAAEGSFVFEGSTQLEATRHFLNGQTTNDRFLSSSAAGSISISDLTNSAVGGIIAANTTFKAAVSYGLGGLAASLNGGTAGTSAYSGVFASVNELQIGRRGALYIIGHIRQIAYYNTRLTNTELQTLTAPQMITTLSLDFINGIYDA